MLYWFFRLRICQTNWCFPNATSFYINCRSARVAWSMNSINCLHGLSAYLPEFPKANKGCVRLFYSSQSNYCENITSVRSTDLTHRAFAYEGSVSSRCDFSEICDESGTKKVICLIFSVSVQYWKDQDPKFSRIGSFFVLSFAFDTARWQKARISVIEMVFGYPDVLVGRGWFVYCWGTVTVGNTCGILAYYYSNDFYATTTYTNNYHDINKSVI